jgi:hypothetical protein
VLTVSVPLLVYVPLIVALGIIFVPLNVFVEPVKVYTPVPAVKVVALFAKLPAMEKVFATLLFHTAPLLRVTSPEIVLAVTLVAKFIVPVIFIAPPPDPIVNARLKLAIPVVSIVNAPRDTVRLPALRVRVPPLLTVINPVRVKLAEIVTVLPLAIFTISVEAGTVPLGHGALAVVEFQLPLPALVIVAACVELVFKKNTNPKTKKIRENFIEFRINFFTLSVIILPIYYTVLLC